MEGRAPPRLARERDRRDVAPIVDLKWRPLTRAGNEPLGRDHLGA